MAKSGKHSNIKQKWGFLKLIEAKIRQKMIKTTKNHRFFDIFLKRPFSCAITTKSAVFSI